MAARCAVYARVSTTDQNPDLQLTELGRYVSERGFELVGQYVDQGVSGTKKSRPELDRLMADARAGKIDVLVVWKFDRFARSLAHLVNSLAEFQQLGVDFISLKDGQDTTTPQGKLMFHVTAAFAEFERGLIVERVRAGMKAAKARGVHCGRRATPARVQAKIRQLRQEGLSFRAISKATGASLPTCVQYAKGATAAPVG